MLKGKMTIELTDINNNVEIIHEENIITNALTEIFRPLGLVKSPSKLMNEWAPYYGTSLGGLLLFDTQLEENPNNLYAPASAKLIGCAAYGNQNNTKGTTRGGYNQTESELNLKDRFMKYVYDFTTSQANGTISSVCLTHLNGGFSSYGNSNTVFTHDFPLAVRICDGQLKYVHTNYTGASTGDKFSGITIGKTEMLFLIDRETDCAYYFRIDNPTSVTIIKRRAYLKSISVLENPYYEKALAEEISISELQISIPTEYIAYNFDSINNSLYIFSCKDYGIKPGGQFISTKIEFNSWNTSQSTMINTTDVNLATYGMRYAFAHNGYVYLKDKYTPCDIYKFEFGNSANVIKINKKGITSISGYPQIAINGRIYYENAARNSSEYSIYIVDTHTNEIIIPENSRLCNTQYNYCYTPVLNEPMLYYVSCGNEATLGFYIIGNYLATINNLSEPVTKTADKTMKITYVIQEQ